MWNVKKTNTEHFARDMYFNNTRYVYLKIHVKDLYCIKILKRENKKKCQPRHIPTEKIGINTVKKCNRSKH